MPEPYPKMIIGDRSFHIPIQLCMDLNGIPFVFLGKEQVHFPKIGQLLHVFVPISNRFIKKMAYFLVSAYFFIKSMHQQRDTFPVHYVLLFHN